MKTDSDAAYATYGRRNICYWEDCCIAEMVRDMLRSLQNEEWFQNQSEIVFIQRAALGERCTLSPLARTHQERCVNNQLRVEYRFCLHTMGLASETRMFGVRPSLYTSLICMTGRAE
jgi:hypothetical protein